MCGIAGTYAPDGGADRDLVTAMTAALRHRGPDGDGHHTDDHVALGVRRLAIVDPECGHQPLRSERGEVVVVFNGELYNHRQLRAWLEQRGHRLASGSDGEVIPHLFEELGPGFVERLEGMFAIALWDARGEALHLYRDEFGIKPLYWAEAGGRLTFASELKPLLLDPRLPRELDPAAVDHFLSLRFVPSPMTPFRAVRKLRPGTILTVDRTGRRERTFAPPPAAADRRDREALVAEYAQAFERAVVGHMMSDRPIGVMLSGGVDSAAITAVMARHSTQVRAFTVGFTAGGDADETDDARATAALFGAAHETVMIGHEEYLSAIERSLLTLEEPVAATSALAVNFVAELMRPSVPVGLSGQGADEPQGGYGRHRGVKLAALARRLPGSRALAARAPRPGRRPALARGLDVLAAGDDAGMLLAALQVLDPGERRRLYRPEFRAAVEQQLPPAATVEHVRRRVAGLDPLGQMLYVDTRLGLADELLPIADKMSMAASVELRVPFLDRSLMRLVESAHPAERLRGLRAGKALHRAAVARLVPREVIERPKRGWATPMDRWLREELRPLLEDVLFDPAGLPHRLFDERALRQVADRHRSGTADHTRELFSLLSLGLWGRAFDEARTPVAVAS